MKLLSNNTRHSLESQLGKQQTNEIISLLKSMHDEIERIKRASLPNQEDCQDNHSQ
jgi:hypothetical protein